VLHRYFRLRARALGVPRLEYHDLYAPLLLRPPRCRTPEEASALLSACLKPLGREYVEALEAGMDGRWIDWHPAPGKRAGAYASGWAYRVHPYVLLNYVGDHASLSTLAHEMGHAMHSHFSNRTQPYATADYSILVAEVASTVNEALLSRHMLSVAADDEERLFLLGSQLDGIRGTLFRQTMFAEFELEIHERAERGEVLTGERLSQLYLELLRDYHGHEQGVVHVADDYAVEWASIPHLHFDFYVYKYATGIVAASALADAICSGSGAARAAYLAFLRAGDSDYPLALLRGAGVDLEAEAPFHAARSAIERGVERLRDLVGGDA
jgi:oligoendopeptidase F